MGLIPIFIKLANNDRKIIGKLAEVRIPTDATAPRKKTTTKSTRVGATRLHSVSSVASKKPIPQSSFQVFKLADLNLTEEQFVEAKKQILELYRINTFNPFAKGAQLTDEQRKEGFLAEPSSFKKYQIQQTMNDSIDVSKANPNSYPFFVAVNPKDKNRIIGVLHPSMTQKFMHNSISSIAMIKTDLTKVIEQLIKSKTIPDMTATNAWHNGGVTIDPNFKGQGIAKALLEQKIQWMKNTQGQNARFLMFGYDAENQASKKFHDKLNTIPLDPAFSTYHVAGRPYVLKVIDLTQPLILNAKQGS